MRASAKQTTEFAMDKISHWFGLIPEFARKRRMWVWSIFFALIALSIPGVMQFRIVAGDEVFFGRDDPVKRAYDNFRVQFGGTDTIYIVYKAKDGDILSPASLKALQGIQDDLLYYRMKKGAPEKSPLDRVIRVHTLINAPYIDKQGDSIVTRQFLGSKIPQDEASREAVRKAAMAEPAYRLTFLSDDKAYGGIAITTDFGRVIEKNQEKPITGDKGREHTEKLDFKFGGPKAVSEANEVPEFEQALWADEKGVVMQAVNDILKAHPDLEYYPVGEPAVVDYLLQTQDVQIALEAVAMLSVIAVLYFAFRSLSAVLWSVCILGVSLLWTIGLMGWMQTVMTNVFILLIIMVWVNGVAVSTHILTAYYQCRRTGLAHREAMTKTAERTGFDSFVMSGTTVIGLLSMTVVPTKPLQNIGTYSAVGFGFVLALGLFVLPLMLDLWHPKVVVSKPGDVDKTEPSARTIRIFNAIADFVIAHPRKILGGYAVAAAVLVFGVSLLKVDANLVKFFPESSTLRQGYELTNRYMMGGTSFDILVEGHDEGTLQDPDVLNAMVDLQGFLEQTFPQWVTKTYSIADIIRKTYRTFDDDDKHAVPSDPKILEEMYFIFSNADLKTRKQWVSDDYGRGRIHVSLRNGGNQVELDIRKEAQAHIDALFAPLKAKHPKLDVTLTGGAILQARLDDYVSRSQAQSFGMTLLGTSIVLLAIFGSLKVGLLAVASNLFAVLITFGLMGLCGFPLTLDSAFSAPVIIGVSIDDTIRFLLHYRHHAKHSTRNAAIRSAITEVGPSLLFTSTVLASGFLIMMGFPLLQVRVMGFFTALAIAIALFANVTLVPALLSVMKNTAAKRRETVDSTFAGGAASGG